MACGRRVRHGSHREGEHRRHDGRSLRRQGSLCGARRGNARRDRLLVPRVQPAVRTVLRRDRRDPPRNEQRQVDVVRDRLSVPVRLCDLADDLSVRTHLHRQRQCDRSDRSDPRARAVRLHALLQEVQRGDGADTEGPHQVKAKPPFRSAGRRQFHERRECAICLIGSGKIF